MANNDQAFDINILEKRPVAGGSTISVTEKAHGARIIKLDTLAGTTVTLPASTGSMAKFKFIVTVLATSNNHIVKVANSSDVMIGMLLELSDDAANVAKGWPALAASDTITLNRTTSGSTVVGEWFEVQDIAVNQWHVSGVIAATGTEISPFSATV